MDNFDYKNAKYKERYEHSHKYLKAYQKNNQGLILWDDWNYCIFNSQNVLDIGCGNGLLCSMLSDMGYKITGIDIADGEYDRSKYDFFQLDITSQEWELDLSGIDTAICFDVLEHLEEKDIKAFINKMFNIGSKQIFSIAHYRVSKCLHKTVRPLDWWEQFFDESTTVLKKINRGGDKNVTLLLRQVR